MTATEERQLLEDYRCSVGAGRPDATIRNALVERHLPLIRSAARAIWSANQCHVELEDLVQAGFVGMLEAIDRFDLAKGTRLSTYALPWIRNAMHHTVRELRWDRRITDEMYRNFMKLNRALARQPVRFDHSIDYPKLSADSGLSPDRCRRLVAWTKSVLSFETPMTKNGKLKLEDTLDDRGVLGPEQANLILDAKETIAAALGSKVLTDQERSAIAAVFFDDDAFFKCRKGTKKSINDALRYRCESAFKKLRRVHREMLEKAQSLFDAANTRDYR